MMLLLVLEWRNPLKVLIADIDIFYHDIQKSDKKLEILLRSNGEFEEITINSNNRNKSRNIDYINVSRLIKCRIFT